MTQSELMHRSDGMEIIRKIAKLFLQANELPEYANHQAVRAVMKKEGRDRIMSEHCLTDLYDYYWFASRAEEGLEEDSKSESHA